MGKKEEEIKDVITMRAGVGRDDLVVTEYFNYLREMKMKSRGMT